MRCRWRPESLRHSHVSPSSPLLSKNPTTTLKRALVFTHVRADFSCCHLLLRAHTHAHTQKHINRGFKLLSLPLAFSLLHPLMSSLPPHHTHTHTKPRSKKKRKIIHYFFYISFSKPIFLSSCLACGIRLCVK